MGKVLAFADYLTNDSYPELQHNNKKEKNSQKILKQEFKWALKYKQIFK